MLTDLQTKKLTRYFRVYDIDDDGGIESADFERIVENVRLLHGVDGEPGQHAAHRGGTARLLAIFDLDESGAIGRSEFRDFYGVFGLAVSLADAVFDTLDLDQDGSISRDELVSLSRQFFRGDDVGEPGNVLYGPYGA